MIDFILIYNAEHNISATLYDEKIYIITMKRFDETNSFDVLKYFRPTTDILKIH